MEKLSLFKDTRKPAFPISKMRAVVAGTVIALMFGLILFTMALKKQQRDIASSPINPHSESKSCFVDFFPERVEMFDPLIHTIGYGHRLERNVSQYQKLTPSDDLLLIPLISEPSIEGFPNKKNISIWSKVIAPSMYHSNQYSLSSDNIPLNLFTLRSDLVTVPLSNHKRWVKIGPSTIFIGKNWQIPESSEYQINFKSYVLNNLVIWGSLDKDGLVSPLKIFTYNPALMHPKDQMLFQIKSRLNAIIFVNLSLAALLALILLREKVGPKQCAELWRSASSYERYEILLSPLVMLVPKTQLGATIFAVTLFLYMSLKFFLKKGIALIQEQRINLYG